jgi:hypothetical protein
MINHHSCDSTGEDEHTGNQTQKQCGKTHLALEASHHPTQTPHMQLIIHRHIQTSYTQKPLSHYTPNKRINDANVWTKQFSELQVLGAQWAVNNQYHAKESFNP